MYYDFIPTSAIILAGAFNFITPFIKILKKILEKLCFIWDKLIRFAMKMKLVPILLSFFELLPMLRNRILALTKSLVICLRSFEPNFYNSLRASK